MKKKLIFYALWETKLASVLVYFRLFLCLFVFMEVGGVLEFVKIDMKKPTHVAAFIFFFFHIFKTILPTASLLDITNFSRSFFHFSFWSFSFFFLFFHLLSILFLLLTQFNFLPLTLQFTSRASNSMTNTVLVSHSIMRES